MKNRLFPAIQSSARQFLLLATLALITACSQTSKPTLSPSAPVLTGILAASELTVGTNRLPIGVVKNGSPVNDPDLKVHMRVFTLDSSNTGTLAGETDAAYRGKGLPFGLYVGYPTFAHAGPWGLEIQMTEPGQATQVTQLRVDVLEKASTPMVGSTAFASQNLTQRDVPDLKQLTSDPAPEPALYQSTIAGAIAARRPFLVAFSTPGFCKTAVCGPNLQVIKQVMPRFRERMDFIHVEVYPYPFSESFQQERLVTTMSEWNLQTEPWTFLVDSQGVIQAKYEGGITAEELELALEQLVSGQAVKVDS